MVRDPTCSQTHISAAYALHETLKPESNREKFTESILCVSALSYSPLCFVLFLFFFGWEKVFKWFAPDIPCGFVSVETKQHPGVAPSGSYLCSFLHFYEFGCFLMCSNPSSQLSCTFLNNFFVFNYLIILMLLFISTFQSMPFFEPLSFCVWLYYVACWCDSFSRF